MEYVKCEKIIEALRTVRSPAMPGEVDLHALIARALNAAGIPYAHEYRLAPRCRLDFFAGRTAIEVKKGKPRPEALAKQLERYLAEETVREMIVVLQREVFLPPRIGGKPVYVVNVSRNWGVALP